MVLPRKWWVRVGEGEVEGEGEGEGEGEETKGNPLKVKGKRMRGPQGPPLGPNPLSFP